MNKNYLLILLLTLSNVLFFNFYAMHKSSKHINLVSMVELSNGVVAPEAEVQQIMESIDKLKFTNGLSAELKKIYKKALCLLLDMCFWNNIEFTSNEEVLEILRNFNLINYKNTPSEVVRNVVISWVDMDAQMQYTFKKSPFASEYSVSRISGESCLYR